jgi:Ni/Co efflux regulator RcnB
MFNKTLLIVAASALTLGATVATAQPYGHTEYNRRDGERHDADRRDGQRYEQHRWARGESLPFQFRDRRYIVNDYYRYGYRVPPRGYAYYRTDAGDIVLAAIATGIIENIFDNGPVYAAPNYNPAYAPPGYRYDQYGRPY